MKRLLLFIIVLTLISFACDESAEVAPDPKPVSIEVTNAQPKGDRILAIDVTDPANGDYDAAINTAINAGAEAVSLSLFWDDIETAPGEYNPEPNFLAIANAYYPTRGIAVDLVINPIDTNQNRLPKDLQDLPFDDHAVIERFNKLLDYVFTQIPDLNLVAFSIGNEIDGHLGTDARKWEEYTNFYTATSAQARTLRPDLVVGTKGMFDGMTGDSAAYFQKINEYSDAIFVTYYPLNSDFTVRDPDIVHEDFAKVVAAYPSKKIYFLELGYPSSDKCNSSEEKQATFVAETFQAWDTHAEQIKVISFSWLNDVSPESVEEYEKYYGFSNRGFAAYLGSLGLLNYDGSEKAAFWQLKAQAEGRGW